ASAFTTVADESGWLISTVQAESKRKQGRSRRQYAFGLSILYNPCKKGPRNSGPFLASAFNLFHQIIDDVTSLN
ncbi:hypothetical protein KK471_31275, partial [Klebsiella pneumoniae]|nr:hypothetical protein [Klebsiella pneumoniae]